MNVYDVEYTDTFSGEANYAWVRRAKITMPELTYYGYTGGTDGSYAKASKAFMRELMRKAKAAVGITGIAGVRHDHGDLIEFRPYKSCTVMFVSYRNE